VKSVQGKFQTQIKNLVAAMETFGNLFKEDSGDVLVLETKDIASEQVVATVNNAGQQLDFLKAVSASRKIGCPAGNRLFSLAARHFLPISFLVGGVLGVCQRLYPIRERYML